MNQLEMTEKVELTILTADDETLSDLLRSYYLRGYKPSLKSCRPVSVPQGVCSHDHSRGEGEAYLYSGARFDDTDEESIAGSAEFSAGDLLRMAQLSVPVSGTLVSDFYSGYFDRKLQKFDNKSINQLLADVPLGVNFESVVNDEFENHFGKCSPAQRLWSALRASSIERRWGVGATRVSKLMAVKRPSLIPIYDRWVAEAFGRKNDTKHWIDMRELFQADPNLSSRLLKIGAPIRPGISAIRVLDVLVWMNGIGDRAMNENGALYAIPTA